MKKAPAPVHRYTSGALVAAMRDRNPGMSDTEAKKAVSDVFDGLMALMQDWDPVRIARFGTFRRKYQHARDARNPRTGEPVHSVGKHVIKFKPSGQL